MTLHGESLSTHRPASTLSKTPPAQADASPLAAVRLERNAPLSDLEKARAGLADASLARTDDGMSALEYVIILVLIAAVAVGTWKTFGSAGEDTLDPRAPSGAHAPGSELTTR